MKISKLLFLLGLAGVMTSCASRKNTVPAYLQNARDTSAPIVTQPPPLIIQKGDLLSIRVYSMSIRPETDVPYNLPEQAVAGTSTTSSSGFLVDQNGNLEYPRIGSVHAEGLTKEQLADLIKTKLEAELTKPSVIVRFVNFKYTVLGEVRTPGSFTALTDKVTILEALGQAGDVTEFGKRNTVKVLRENNGVREIGTVDLSSKDMFQSSYYHLQQNDVVLVESTGQRERRTERQDLFQQIGITISILTAVALILNFFK